MQKNALIYVFSPGLCPAVYSINDTIPTVILCQPQIFYLIDNTFPRGRHQNTSVENSDFLQKNVKCMLVAFCRSVTPSPHFKVKGHLGDDSQLLLYYTW